MSYIISHGAGTKKSGRFNALKHAARVVENPVSGTAIRVELTLPQSESVVCRLYSAQGELVENFAPVVAPQGVSRPQLSLRGVAEGVYFLQITTARAHIVRQVMVF